MIAAAISRLRDAGFTVAATGDRLAITGPLMTEPQRAWLAQHKAEILVALNAEVSQHPLVAAALAEWPDATIIAIRDHHDQLNDPKNPDAWA